MSERKYSTSIYKYTGPTMLLGKYDQIELHNGMEVDAEVNVNVATITKIYDTDGSTTVLNDAATDVAAKYLEPVKPDTINFKDDVDVPHFFDNLFDDIAKIQAHAFRNPKDSTLEYLKKLARERNSHDNIEVGGDHYQTAIQPWDYIYANKLGFDEGNVVKYISRHKDKGGAEDIKKVISYCKHILKTQYGEDYGKEATENER